VKSIRPGTLVLAVSAGLLMTGCGSTAVPHAAHAGASPPSVDPTAVTVIRSWSNALRRGDVAAAARYFALPSEFANGPVANGELVVVTIRTEAQAVTVNSGLSCGSVLISVHQQGRYVNALFRLTNRGGPGGGCGSGAGQLARTDFLIAGGRIVEWIRAPEAPDGGTSPQPAIPTPGGAAV
jgi:hypothetical protein